MIPPKAIKKVKNETHLEMAAGFLLFYKIFPRTNEGIEQAKKTAASKDTWLAPSDLPEYYGDIDSDIMMGRENDAIRAIRNHFKEFYGLSSAGTADFEDTQVYTPANKFVDDAKEFVIDREKALEDALEETSNNIMDAIDDILKKDQEKFEEFKEKQAEELKKKIEKINAPERVAEELTIKIPPAHYIQGTAGRWQPEFESDIDHAIYFAGKSPLPKGAKQREVLDWLKSLGLTYEQIHDHREKVLEQIRETISLPGVEEEYPYVYIDAVDQDFVLDTNDEDFDEIEDDLEGLDDLLDLVRTDDDKTEKEVSENIEEEILDAAEDEEDEGDIGSEDDIPDELLQDEVDPELLEKLLVTINKPKKESSYTSNKKIFDAIITNFGRIQATLDIVNRNLETQNDLIKASIETQLAVGELISNQTSILDDKFGLILQQFQSQADIAQQQNEALESKSAEDKLEAQRDAAGVADYQDLTKGPQKKKRENKIEKYLKSRLTRKLYRKLPKSVRKARQKVRKLQKFPGKVKAKAVNKITSLLPSKGKQAVSALSKVRGAGSVGKLTGPARYAFAGLEYSERKAEGQSEIQALSGVGGGLAGAAAGGKAGALFGGKIGLLLGPKGAAVGAIIGGLLGSIVGGVKGSEAVDSFTGADEVTGEHETGTGLTKPGTAILHGTEAVVPESSLSPMSTLGGVMLAATSQYINAAGAIAAPIAPTFKGITGQMAKEYDIPSTVTQTNVGGSLPQLDSELKKVREKKTGTPEEEFTGVERDLLDTQNEETFAEKLLNMIDPEGKILELMKNINRGAGGTGDSPFFPSSGDPSGLADAAESLKGMSSASGPSGGANGCVWAVNKVYEKAGITPPWGSSLYVPDAEKKMVAAGYTQVGYGDRRPGDVMVMYDRKSPPQAHIGVVLKNGNILSNSSSKAKFAWEATPEQYNSYYGGTGKIYRMPSTMARTESNKLQPVATTTTPNLSSSGKRSNTRSTVSTTQHQVKPTTPSTQSTPQQVSSTQMLSNKSTEIALNQGPSSPIKYDEGMNQYVPNPGAGRPGNVRLKPHMLPKADSLNPPQQNSIAQVSAPPQRQRTVERTMEIASLSYDNTEQSNDMMIINNQQPSMPPMPAGSPSIEYNVPGRSSTELLKDLMLQRLTA
jgi:hypothetical protein